MMSSTAMTGRGSSRDCDVDVASRYRLVNQPAEVVPAGRITARAWHPSVMSMHAIGGWREFVRPRWLSMLCTPYVQTLLPLH
jgi:hypothetical protein